MKYHMHHILPKHSGGNDKPCNLIKLTVRQHAKAHKELWEEHGCEEDRIAWKALSGQNGKGEQVAKIKVEYVDHMGSDLTVVNAARVSFNKEVTEMTEKDEKLIHYLALHGHFTPTTHCMITLRETVPIFVARQRFKHTVGFSYNEMSRRYVQDAPEFFEPDAWREAAENVKQGSSDVTFELEDPIYTMIDNLHDRAEDLYDSLLESGVAAEQARMVLPQSVMTSYYVTGSLSAWLRAFELRSHQTAQKEIQDVAKRWEEIIKPLFPVSWDANVSLKDWK